MAAPSPSPLKKKRGRPPKNPPVVVVPPKPKSTRGRKSKLREFQWEEIKRKHIVDKVPMSKLAKEYGISETALQERISGEAKEIVAVAKEKAELEAKISGMPISGQGLVNMVFENLRAAAINLSSAAANGASTAARVSRLANLQTEKLDEAADFQKNEPILRDIAAMTQVANEAARVPLAIMVANKEQAAQAAREEKDITPQAISSDPAIASKAYLEMIGR